MNEKVERVAPPDGAYGWVIVCGAFVLQFCIVFNWSPFGVYYLELSDYFDHQRDLVVWIHPVMLVMQAVAGMFAGYFIDRIGYRILGIAGIGCYMVGYVITFFASHVAVIILSYGALTGVGNTFLYMSAVMSVQDYFEKRLGVASALALIGVSAAFFVGAPLAQLLIDAFGWRGAFLIEAGILMHGLPAAMLMRPLKNRTIKSETEAPLQNGKQSTENATKLIKPLRNKRRCLGSVCNLQLLKDQKYILYLVCLLSNQIAYHMCNVFKVPRAVSLGVDRQKAAALTIGYGIGNLIGRLPVGWVGDRTNHIILFGSLNIVCGLATICNSFLYSYAGMMGYMAVFGFLAGGIITIQPTALRNLMGLERLSSAQGLAVTSVGLGGMTAAPLAESFYKLTNSYDTSYVVAGSAMVIGGGIFTAYFTAILVQTKFNKKRMNIQQQQIYSEVPLEKV